MEHFVDKVTTKLLNLALQKLQKRHPLLRTRIEVDDKQIAWFTSERVPEIPIQVISRSSNDQLIQLCLGERKIPFSIEKGPLIRFILLQSSDFSDLVILGSHAICDGLALVYLTRDIMYHLGDPQREVELLPEPLSLVDFLPPKTANFLVKMLFNRINKKWEKDKVIFDEEDFQNIVQIYWKLNSPGMFIWEISESQTSTLVERCRKEGVSVNTAILTAFAAAQYEIQGSTKPYLHKFGIAVNVRNRLTKPIGELLGSYASTIDPTLKYRPEKPFWDMTRTFQHKINQQLKGNKFLNRTVFMKYLDQTFFPALVYWAYGKDVSPSSSRYEKLSTFSNDKNNAVASFAASLARSINLDSPTTGLMTTNLGRTIFPEKYGSLELANLMFLPGGSRTYEKILGIITACGKLNFTLSYLENVIDTSTMKKVKDKAMNHLKNEVGWPDTPI
ncbi:MAG: condensation domain-containing protein [Candidatus Hodarchaeota archaeon]